jgi:hypothetical protein
MISLVFTTDEWLVFVLGGFWLEERRMTPGVETTGSDHNGWAESWRGLNCWRCDSRLSARMIQVLLGCALVQRFSTL